MANSPSGDSMLTRLVGILGAFDATRTSMTVSALARRVDIPLATTHRLVVQLVDQRLLERDENGEVRLGVRLWELASRGSRTTDLRQIALPFMEDVQTVVQEHTTLGVLDGEDVLYVERLTTHGSAVNITQIAGRLPIYACSSGLVLLAYSAPDFQEDMLHRQHERYTDQTPTIRRRCAGCSLRFGSWAMRAFPASSSRLRRESPCPSSTAATPSSRPSM